MKTLLRGAFKMVMYVVFVLLSYVVVVVVLCCCCLMLFVGCGWCGPSSSGRCVPTYRSYGGITTGTKSPRSPTSGAGTKIDYSPLCATPATALNWLSCPAL